MVQAKFSEPILRIVDWFEKTVLNATLNQSAHRQEPAYLFFDEVQNLPAWDVQLKSLVDHATVRVMVTGSSALRIAMGRDSLAGRIHSLEVGPLRLAEIAALRGFESFKPMQRENGWQDWLRREFWQELTVHARSQSATLAQAFSAFSERGAYPLAQVHAGVSWQDIAEQLKETVVKRVIEHDLRVGERAASATASCWKRCSAWAVATSGKARIRRHLPQRHSAHWAPTSAHSASATTWISLTAACCCGP